MADHSPGIHHLEAVGITVGGSATPQSARLEAVGITIGASAAPQSAPPHPERRRRRPTLASAIEQAAKAGKDVAAATVAPDGTFSLTFGQPGMQPNGKGNIEPETPEDLRKLL